MPRGTQRASSSMKDKDVSHSLPHLAKEYPLIAAFGARTLLRQQDDATAAAVSLSAKRAVG